MQIAVYKPDENELKLGEKTLQEWNKRIVQHKALFDRPAALEGLLLQVAAIKSSFVVGVVDSRHSTFRSFEKATSIVISSDLFL